MSIQKAYDEWSGTYDTDENRTRDLDREVLRQALANLRFESILEIGCGTGKNTSFLAEIGKNVQAVDFSPGMIEQARQKVRAENVSFAQADITQRWSGRDRTLDLIVCCLILEHVQDLSFIFSEAARTLKERGAILIHELHPFRQYEGRKARFQRGAEVTEIPAFVHHISDFTSAASGQGLRLLKLDEWWHAADQDKPPRLVSFLFEK